MNKLVDSFDHDDIPDVGCMRAVLAELVLTFLFVFTGVSAAMAAGTYLSVHSPRVVRVRPPPLSAVFIFLLLLIPLGPRCHR